MKPQPGASWRASGAAEQPLDEDNVVGYLRRRGILPPTPSGPSPRVRALGGGVSSIVLLVEAGPKRVVVKQPRRRLLVEEEWFASTGRAMSEASAIDQVRRVTPESVPPVLDVDPGQCIITMAAAPPAWEPWKDLLLGGAVEPSVGSCLGRILGAWHSASRRKPALIEGLFSLDAFLQLRIEPFHQTVAERHPDLSRNIDLAVDELVGYDGTHCLVHGDFSPKNVLLGPEGMWVIDFEVAHAGNPIFDLAFLLTHLLLKSLHLPTRADAYRRCAEQFLLGYMGATDGWTGDRPDEFGPRLGLHVGCLVLARVDGKSPAEYLTGLERDAARRVGRQLVSGPVDALSAFSMAEKVASP